MNLTDLRDELQVRANDLAADPSAIRSGVSRRITSTKRRRAVGAVGGLCAAVLAAGLVLPNQPGRQDVPAPAVPSPTVTLGADGLPERTIPDSPGDVVKDGLRFRAKAADDVLAAGAIGDPGQRSLSVEWTPTTQHISYAAECYLPSGTDAATVEATHVRASISGSEGYLQSSCQNELPARDLPSGGGIPGEPGQGNPDLEVGVAASLTVELVTREGTPTTVPGARLVGAVYELGPQQEVTDASGRVVAALPQAVEHQGYTYLLEGIVTRPAARGPLPEIATPTGVPFLVTYGSSGTGSDVTGGAFYLDGLDAESSLIGSGGWSTVPQPAREAGNVQLRLDGPRPKSGVAFVATYVPAA